MFSNNKIPTEIGSLKNLVVLQLSNNSLIGEIPAELGKYESLVWLDLSSNKLLTLVWLDLSSNKLIGSIPRELPIQSVIIYIHSTTLYASQKNMSMIYLDLSYNHLSNRIPNNFGSIRYLVVLNLGHKMLTGSIPDSFVGQTQLEVLDLSYNYLEGNIPQSLESLTFLNEFHLSNNNLNGKIPSEGQLASFLPSAYENNSGLCDDRLLPCQSLLQPSPGISDSTEKKNTIEVGMVLSIVAGFFVGIRGFEYTLLFKDSWRYAYFGFIEKMHDMISVFVEVKMAKLRNTPETSKGGRR
ncbi:hypothetical protein GIB67_008802 [Kingdonia uniflora]|uniref:Uncharacterized protein n=1 Tax=Kingdonia uniflora TaxID=39325 RepID=A0A7J7MHL0_9MAGN|nr:hypothetical protein GIB67_008802 [Kingdonia uniflora]